MISFITGDGDENRTHRKNMFRNDINFIGASSGDHRDTEICTVVCFAGNVRDLGSIAPEIVDFIPNYIKKITEEKEKGGDKVKKIKT